MRSGASVVECGKNPWGLALLNEITDDFVIEVVDRRPFDLLPDVFFLLGLECQLDKDLLEFLVYIIDAQLLERVVLSLRKNISSVMETKVINVPRKFQNQRCPVELSANIDQNQTPDAPICR